jgi:hypothetical protein
VQANIQLVLTYAGFLQFKYHSVATGFLQTKYKKAVARVAKTIPENINIYIENITWYSGTNSQSGPEHYYYKSHHGALTLILLYAHAYTSRDFTC